ncbi:MAG: hypothetical protein KDK63_04855 [Chlamydiia bacterium]|nr:hypothetical protein [Chlamydiia bacterium]
MELYEEVKNLEKQINTIASIEELREVLKKKDLKLIVVILSKSPAYLEKSFSCLEWDINQGQVSKVLNLGLRVRISKISDETQALETIRYEQLCVKETNWEDLDSLFEILKRGMKQCLRNIDK